MNEFINWATLGTYGGALAMVMVLTQFTKDLPFTKKIPTQIWSYILAFVVLFCAMAFTNGLTLNTFVQTLFNAVIVSIASNGGFSAIRKVTDKSNGE
jgi:O-antigen ligase